MPSGSYSRIRLTFWTDPDIKRSLTPEQKALLLYYFSSPHANMIGLFHCPLAYVVEETGLPLEQVREWTAGPLARFVSYDPRTEEVLVHRAARHQIADDLASADKRVKAIVAILRAAHSKWLVRRFLELYAGWPLNVEKPEADPPPPMLNGASKPHPMPLRSHSSSSAVHGITDTVSKETGADAPPSFPQPELNGNEAPHAYLMPILRQQGYNADQTDGSIVKALIKKGVSTRDIEVVVLGLAMMRDNGRLRHLLLEADDKLNMKMLYATGRAEKMPLWREAEVEYFRNAPKENPAAMKKLGNVLGVVVGGK